MNFSSPSLTKNSAKMYPLRFEDVLIFYDRIIVSERKIKISSLISLTIFQQFFRFQKLSPLFIIVKTIIQLI